MSTNGDGHERFHLGTLRSEITYTVNVVFTVNIVGVGPEFMLVRNRSDDFYGWGEDGIGGDGIGRGRKLEKRQEGPKAGGRWT